MGCEKPLAVQLPENWMNLTVDERVPPRIGEIIAGSMLLCGTCGYKHKILYDRESWAVSLETYDD